MVREAAKRVVIALPRENVSADIVGEPSFEIFDGRQPNGTDGFTLLTVLQPQAARLCVGLRPFQADHLASPAAGQGELANDVPGRSVFLLGAVAERLTLIFDTPPPIVDACVHYPSYGCYRLDCSR